jgi:hypothetical protein
MSMLLTLLLTCVAFLVSVSSGFPPTAHAFFPQRLSNHCQGLYSNFSLICTTFYAVSLSDPSPNRIRPDTQLHITGRKTQ